VLVLFLGVVLYYKRQLFHCVQLFILYRYYVDLDGIKRKEKSENSIQKIDFCEQTYVIQSLLIKDKNSQEKLNIEKKICIHIQKGTLKNIPHQTIHVS